MKVGIVATLRHHKEPAGAFKKGLQRHGIYAEIHNNPRNVPANDLIVVWGLRNGNLVKNKCQDFLVMERAYFEPRMEWISLGFNGLNGHADFLNKDMPSDRWEKYFKNQMMPWDTSGDYILLTTQVNGDQSIRGLNFSYQDIVRKLKANTNTPIKVKHHPLNRRPWGNLGVPEINKDMPIKEAIRKAKVVVTVNSNTGVDAILMGKPVININKGSMVWDVAMQNDFSRIDDPYTPDRSQWAYNTSYCQWLPIEIQQGAAWAHLKQRYI